MAIFVLAGLASGAVADPKQKARADQLFDDGRRYLTNKEYQLACTAFEASEAADPAIGTQLNIALCYDEWGHIASAYRAFIEAERLAKLKHDNRAKAAHDKIAELGPKVPRLNISVTPDTDPSALFVLDGKEIDRAALVDELLLDAGSHSVETRVPGQPPKTTTIELHNGEHKEIVIDVPKSVATATPPVSPAGSSAPRDPTRLYGGIGFVAGGAIAIAVASIVSIRARNDYINAIANCPGGLCESRDAYDTTQDARRRATYMTFVGGGGVALAAVGVYLLVTSHGEAQHVAPVVAPGVVGVAIGGAL